MTDPEALAALFERVFGEAEGAEEGAALGRLVRALFAATPEEDLHLFTEGEAGAIFFTPLAYPEDGRRAVLLSPVAVAPERQRTGVGTRLIGRGLAEMAARGADVALTYGDPAYYGRLGFAPAPAEDAAPPHPLSMPFGWQARPLSARGTLPLAGPSRCVPAFDDPGLW